jgi:DNA-binding XRE family transcriptional regulator
VSAAGCQLRAIRRRAGLTREAAAAAIGAGPEALRKWETGRSVPRGHVVVRLWRLFGTVEVLEIYAGDHGGYRPGGRAER